MNIKRLIQQDKFTNFIYTQIFLRRKWSLQKMIRLPLYLLLIFVFIFPFSSYSISQTKLNNKQVQDIFSASDNNLVILILQKKLSKNKIEDINLMKDFAKKNKHILFFEIDCNNNSDVITNFIMDNDFTAFLILSNTIIYIYPDDTHNKTIPQIIQKLSPKLVQIDKKHKQLSLHKKIDSKNNISSGTYVLENYNELVKQLNSIDYDNIFHPKRKYKKSDIVTLPDGRTIYNHEVELFEDGEVIEDDDDYSEDEDEEINHYGLENEYHEFNFLE